MHKAGSLLVLLLVFALLLTFSNLVQAQSCTDSDGGDNMYVAGLTDGRVNGIGSYFYDVCVTSQGGAGCSGSTCTAVAEGFCDANGVTNQLRQCPNLCSNGQCNAPANTTSPSPSPTNISSPSPSPTGTTTCANGSIPGNGACMCNGVTYSTGYCCSGVYSSSTPCSTNAPQCAEGPVPSSGCLCSGYAYISGNCCKSGLQSGLVWSGNTPCTQTCPTIAKNVNPSYSGVCCSGSASDCKGTWSGQWGIDCQGYTCCIGTSQPLCTGTSYGDGAPSPTPTAFVVPGAGAPEPSNNDPGVWAQVEVSSGQIVTTAICTKSVCGLNGEWHGYVPPPSYSSDSVWWPTSKRYIWQMQGQAGYSSGTFNFNTYVFTVTGGTIYNGQLTPTTTSSPSLNQTNYTSTPSTSSSYSPSPTSSPTYTPSPTTTPIYPTPTTTPYQPPSLSCSTDSDCSWTITNSCPESAGANWQCSSLLQPLPAYISTACPDVISLKPSLNCGCIQNRCSVFQFEKPTEPPRKIGNTDFDTTKLFAAVIQMEQLTVKFNFLKSATNKLTNYYNSTGNTQAYNVWLSASQMIEQGIKRIEELRTEVRNKLDTFTIEDLRKLKSDIKSVINIIKEIVRSVLSLPPSTPGPGSPRGGDPNQTNQSGGGSNSSYPANRTNQTIPIPPINQTNQTNGSIPGSGGFGQGGLNQTNQTNQSGGSPRFPGNQTNQTSGGGSSSGNLTIPTGPSGGSNQTNQTNGSIPGGGGFGQGNSTNQTNGTGG